LKRLMLSFRPRYELKYIISSEVAHAIEGKLTGYCEHDAHGREGCYINETLYFDSPALDFYFQKVEGIKLRRKVRIRRHGDAGPWERAFVEIKRRNGQYIEKSRFSLPAPLLPLLFDRSQRQAICDSLTPGEVQVYNEVSALSRLLHLRPIIFIRYQRKAFWAKGDERLRITFDSNISYDVANHDCLSPLTNTQPLLEGDQIVMEVKANGRIPFWVLELIKECGCRMVRFSKYCLGVQRSQELRGMYLNYAGKETAPPAP